MDYREKAFRVKFEHVARQLGTAPHEVASLKLRGNVGGYQEYRDLLNALTQEAGLKSTPTDGDLQGTGHLVQNSKTKIIVVEHESGLEILYIAGSVASLVGLIPLVLKCWSTVRGHIGRSDRHDFQPVELRRLGDDGHIIEERSHGLPGPWASPLSAMNTALLSAAEVIDAELHQMRQSLHALGIRVTKLEGKKQIVRGAQKPRISRNRPK